MCSFKSPRAHGRGGICLYTLIQYKNWRHVTCNSSFGRNFLGNYSDEDVHLLHPYELFFDSVTDARSVRFFIARTISTGFVLFPISMVTGSYVIFPGLMHS